jgi:hypothetical protein
MIDHVLDLFQQFKDRKQEKQIIAGSDDRSLVGLLAVATAINRLADTIAEFKPMVAAVVDAYLNQPEYVISDDTFQMSAEDVEFIKSKLSNRLDAVSDDNDANEDSESATCTNCGYRHYASDQVPCRDCHDESKWSAFIEEENSDE